MSHCIVFEPLILILNMNLNKFARLSHLNLSLLRLWLIVQIKLRFGSPYWFLLRSSNDLNHIVLILVGLVDGCI